MLFVVDLIFKLNASDSDLISNLRRWREQGELWAVRQNAYPVSVDSDFCIVVVKVHITRSTRVITHFNLQQKVPLNKVIFAPCHLPFVVLRYDDSFCVKCHICCGCFVCPSSLLLYVIFI